MKVPCRLGVTRPEALKFDLPAPSPLRGGLGRGGISLSVTLTTPIVAALVADRAFFRYDNLPEALRMTASFKFCDLFQAACRKYRIQLLGIALGCLGTGHLQAATRT